jgi:PAS domain S-box-containing protein
MPATRKSAESRFRPSADAEARLTEHLLAVFEHAPSGVALVRGDGRFLRVNPALSVMLGRPADTLMQMSWNDVVHPDDRAAADATARRALAGEGVEAELRARRPDGAVVHLRVTARGLGGGEPLMVAHCEDRTARLAREATLEAVVDAAAEAIVGVDENDVVRIFSPSAERMFGWPAEQMIGTSVWTLVSPSRVEQGREVREALAAGRTVHREGMMPRRDGSLVEVYVTAGPILGEDGAYCGAALTILDVSDRRRAEREAGRSRDLLQQLIDAAPNVIAFKDRQSRYRLINRLGTGIFGLEASEIVGRTDYDLMGSETAAANHAEDVRAMAAGRPLTFTKDVEMPDGSVRPHLTTKFPILAPDGSVDGIGVIAVDISELRRGEADRARLGALAEAAPDAIVINDVDGTITSWNPGAEQMFDLPAVEAVGRSYEQLVVPEADRETYQRVRRDLSYGRSRTLRMGALRGDGSIFPAQVSAAALADGRGTVAIIRDITDLVAAQRELERSNAELERFAIAASHDLQEPLRTIRMGAETVMTAAGERLDEDERDLLSHVEQAAGRMSSQVKALMNVARVALEEAPEESMPLQRALDDALAALDAAIREADAQINVDGRLPAAGVPRAEMALVFQNLLSNAIKFGRPGERPSVVLRAREAGGYVELRVADNGIGLTEAAAAKIFGLFERDRTGVPGTGVGLAVCRQILERRGGSISVSSGGSGQGAAFTLRLPAAGVASRSA